jgi:redox-sensitive bicupin YhaK (pirin superfamily)
MKKAVTVHIELQHMSVGPFKVKQPLPSSVLDQVSPFILLHHAGPTRHAPGEIKSRLSPHPHRGFEPVTFLFSGKIHHRDSTGSEGFLESGDVQWMTAGSGIIHSEGPSSSFAEEGGEMELIQLWVNLPREMKMTKPKYQDLKKRDIPLIEENGFSISVVAGKFREHHGPASTFTPITAMMMNFKKGAHVSFEVPESWNHVMYVLDGSVTANGETVKIYNLAVFGKEGNTIELDATSDGRLLFLSGEPISEPVVSYGPFVMNYPGDIKQAILDYETGKMGVLES